MAAVGGSAYQELATAYDWLVPEALLTPEGNAAMFEEQLATLDRGAHALDCACGTGTLAVGLALRGFEVAASDASPAMVERTRALAAEHGVDIDVKKCAWEELPERYRPSLFQAVFCVGNSLTHAPGRNARRSALEAMRSVMDEGALLVLTSRNWEKVRAEAFATEQLVERYGTQARVTHRWHIAPGWDDPHYMDVTVELPGATYSERLDFWPFTHEALDADLRAAGFEPWSGTYGAEAERYLVTATRASTRSS